MQFHGAEVWGEISSGPEALLGFRFFNRFLESLLGSLDISIAEMLFYLALSRGVSFSVK